MTTATTAGARAHARAQGGTVIDSMPTLPASAANAPAGVAAEDLVWAETIAGGGYASKVLARGTTVELTDLEGDACTHLLLFNAFEPVERLNIADTVKVLWQAYVTAGHPLLSDQGRVLATVTADTAERSDTFVGTSTLSANQKRYGSGSPESGSPAGRELFTLAAAKHGLSRRDLPPSISFFQGVRVKPDGSFDFLGSSGPGAQVRLVVEMPVTLLIVNVPHPLDPRPDYVSTPVRVRAWRDSPTGPDDPQWSATPEGERAYLNTADYLTARGIA